jgi:hypothetical protein
MNVAVISSTRGYLMGLIPVFMTKEIGSRRIRWRQRAVTLATADPRAIRPLTGSAGASVADVDAPADRRSGAGATSIRGSAPSPTPRPSPSGRRVSVRCFMSVGVDLEGRGPVARNAGSEGLRRSVRGDAVGSIGPRGVRAQDVGSPAVGLMVRRSGQLSLHHAYSARGGVVEGGNGPNR